MLRSPADLERLRAGGRVLLALGMENGAPIGDDLAKLAQFHARGVRYITLAHSANNRISDSSYTVQKQWGGLSPFGEKVVARDESRSASWSTSRTCPTTPCATSCASPTCR